MADQRGGDAWIEHDRHGAAVELAGIEPLHRALAGLAADLGRVRQLVKMGLGFIVPVTLHAGVLAGDGGGRNAVRSAPAGATEPQRDRKSVGQGKSGSVRVDLGVRTVIKKN